MPTVAVNGIDIYYELHGDGPPLLNISGSGNDLRRSPASVLPLNQVFQTLWYDQRGLGQSSKPDGAYSMADYADDAAALASALGWDSCHVLGTSFGGMVALNLALRHPALVDRLVLCCTSAGGVSPSYPLHELATMAPSEAFATRMSITDTRWDPDADEPIPDLGRMYERIAERPELDPEQLAGLGRQMMARAGHDVVADLSSIACPTLVCAGRFDAIAPVENSELIAGGLPTARLQVFDGGHYFMVQDRTAFPAISEFLSA